MNRKTLTFGESNVAALSAFFGMAGGTLILTAAATLTDMLTDGSFSESVEFGELLMVLTQLFMFAGAFFYLSVFRKANYFKLFSFGFDKLNAKKVGLLLLITVGSILLFVPFADLFVWILTLFGYKASGEIAMGDGFGGFLTLVVSAAIFPAFFEEMLFRGVYLNGARKRGAFFAVTYTAFVFMIYHGNPMQTVHQFFLGIVLTYLAVISGHIGYGIVVHFFNNFIAILMAFIPFGKLSAGWSAFISVVWIFVGIIILIPSLKAFARMNAKERNISLKAVGGASEGRGGFSEQNENVPPYGKAYENPSFAQNENVPPYGKVYENPPFAQNENVPPYGKVYENPSFGQNGRTASPYEKVGGNDSRQDEKKGFFDTVISDITDTFSKIIALLKKKKTVKESTEEFNARYDKLNEFDGEIPDDVIFAFGKGDGKTLPVSAILLIIGFSAMWLFMFVVGFLNIPGLTV
jgi:membrane protease YdiL (CAAX protease family)